MICAAVGASIPVRVGGCPPAQAGHPERLPQQDRPGLGHQSRAVGGHGDPGAACAILPLESAFGW